MVHMATDVAYVGDEHLWLDAAYLVGLNVVLWLVSLLLGKCWPVDFIWSGWPPVLCAIVLAGTTTGSRRTPRTDQVRKAETVKAVKVTPSPPRGQRSRNFPCRRYEQET